MGSMYVYKDRIKGESDERISDIASDRTGDSPHLNGYDMGDNEVAMTLLKQIRNGDKTMLVYIDRERKELKVRFV